MRKRTGTGQALGAVLPLAVAVAIFPVPVIAVALLLGSDGGRAKGLAFVAAWCVGLATVGAIVLLVAGGADATDAGEPALWVDLLLLGLGVLLLVLAARQWRGRPPASEASPMPGWMRTVDTFTSVKAAASGFALTALNPKNVLLVVAAAAEIAEADISAGSEIAVLLAFVVVASLGVLAPVVVTVALGERSREPLERLKGWMARNNAVIMAVLFLLIGTKLVGDAISGFSS